jgi:hypothetical protein
MKSLILDDSHFSNDFYSESKLIGIVTSFKGYKFCWQLNKFLGLKFKLNNALEIQLKKTKKGIDAHYFFQVYQFNNVVSNLDHLIYHNQFKGEYLLPEYKHIDFIWMMKGDVYNNPIIENLIQRVKQLEGLQLMLDINSEKLKNKENLFINV